jgi:predicted acetyltransferase
MNMGPEGIREHDETRDSTMSHLSAHEGAISAIYRHTITLWNQLGGIGEREHEPWFRDILLQSLRTLDEIGCQAWWLTNWPIVKIAQNTVIGGITFKGPPNQAGEVEIGYGIADTYRNKGYMTECLRALVRWALHQDGVAAVTAETAKENLPSEAVLRKNGFEHVRDTEEFRSWSIQAPIHP